MVYVHQEENENEEEKNKKKREEESEDDDGELITSLMRVFSLFFFFFSQISFFLSFLLSHSKQSFPSLVIDFLIGFLISSIFISRGRLEVSRTSSSSSVGFLLLTSHVSPL